MISNYFEAYTLTNNDIEGLTLNLGYISKMAGWENGVDAKKFVNIGETLGTSSIDGVYFTSASYDKIKDLSLSFWYYHFTDIADVLYTELGYEAHVSTMLDVILGLQYDTSSETGAALLGKQDADTFGISIEFIAKKTGIHIFAAYNKDTGETGASGLHLGGGPLFTSMENQTLDATGNAGQSWLIHTKYHFQTEDTKELYAGIAYGHFSAHNTLDYDTKEIDTSLEYHFNNTFSVTATYATIHFNHIPRQNYTQIRLISNYNF